MHNPMLALIFFEMTTNRKMFNFQFTPLLRNLKMEGILNWKPCLKDALGWMFIQKQL